MSFQIVHFNLLLSKENGNNKGMYSEWASLTPHVQYEEGSAGVSVLDKFGMTIGKEVTLGIVRQLAGNLGIAQPAEPSPLTTDKEVLHLNQEKFRLPSVFPTQLF